MNLPTLFFFKIVWLFWIPWIAVWFLESASQFLQKNTPGVLIDVKLYLQINFGSNPILAILSHLIHKPRKPSHLFRSLIYFSNVLLFSVYKSCNYFVKFILEYFINWYCLYWESSMLMDLRVCAFMIKSLKSQSWFHYLLPACNVRLLRLYQVLFLHVRKRKY